MLGVGRCRVPASRLWNNRLRPMLGLLCISTASARVRRQHNCAGGVPRSRVGAGRALLAVCTALAVAATLSGAGAGQVASTETIGSTVGQLALNLRYEIYQVGPGDTVENIAARFGVPAEQIRNLNGLGPSAELRPGESLAVPLAGGIPHASSPEASDSDCQSFEPRYARVLSSSPIVRAPSGAADAQTLYWAEAGCELVAHEEREGWWGIVMVDGSTGWIAKSDVELTERAVPAEKLEILLKGGRPDIVQAAFRFLGTPYRYGGRLPYDMDCSLLVQIAYAARGIGLPRTAAEQFQRGSAVSCADLLPGDRLYFVSRSGRINHTGIYIGNGRFIHASSRRGCVAVDSLAERVYWTRFVGARRS